MFGGGGLIGLATKAYGALKSRKKSSGSGSSSSSEGAVPSGASNDQGDPAMHKGGKVKKTRSYRLKKGERVLTKGQQKKLIKKKGSHK